MKNTKQSRVVGLLGVGFDGEEGQIRITQADDYQVLMGSKESHQALQKMCLKIEVALQKAGRSFRDYTPEEFMSFMGELY